MFFGRSTCGFVVPANLVMNLNDQTYCQSCSDNRRENFQTYQKERCDAWICHGRFSNGQKDENQTAPQEHVL